MIAAIGRPALGPVVCGLGETAEAARADAASRDDVWCLGGSATCEVSQEIADRVSSGEVACESLGIVVRCDRDGQIVYADSAISCQCGAWSGLDCSWHGLVSQTVLVEWMPEQHRASHRAAGNVGAYPHNGAVRLRVRSSCAALMSSDGPEWFRIVRNEVQS